MLTLEKYKESIHLYTNKKRLINKENFFLRDLVEGFDGDKLKFSISVEESEEKFKRKYSSFCGRIFDI